jgi:hypothetical protein
MLVRQMVSLDDLVDDDDADRRLQDRRRLSLLCYGMGACSTVVRAPLKRIG